MTPTLLPSVASQVQSSFLPFPYRGQADDIKCPQGPVDPVLPEVLPKAIQACIIIGTIETNLELSSLAVRHWANYLTIGLNWPRSKQDLDEPLAVDGTRAQTRMTSSPGTSS